MTRRCRSSKTPACQSSSSSEDCRDGGGSFKNRRLLCDEESRLAAGSRLSNEANEEEAGALGERTCLDALLRENIFLAVLLFLEVADATRFGSCCTELQAALRAPRVQPLWRRWFERSGFVWWPYGGVCGGSCRIEVDSDGFVMQQQQRRLQQQKQQQVERAEGARPPTGYKRFGHEGWCCQFLWNARALENWRRGSCVPVSLPTDSHKLCMVSVHPKALYASRAEAAIILSAASAEPPATGVLRDASAGGAQLLEEQQVEQQQLLQRQQQLLQIPSASELGSSDQVAPSSAPHSKASCQRVVHFSPGAGEGLLRTLRENAVILTAANDRVVCFLEPQAGAPAPCSKSPKGPLLLSSQSSPLSAPSGNGRAAKDAAAAIASPMASQPSGGPSFSMEHLELELESLISGGSCRKSRGKSRKNGHFRHTGAASAAAEMRTPTSGGDRSGFWNFREAPAREAAAANPVSPALLATSTEHAYPQASAAAAGAAAAVAAVGLKEICRCAPGASWLGCNVDAASGLMVCCIASNEQNVNTRRRRRKGGGGAGAADACEYRLFDLLAEREIAQLAIDGQLVHSLLLNFVFSQDAERVFAFDRWHREFFVWDVNDAVFGSPLEAAAAVNAHTDGILALDCAGSAGSCRVLCGSRDESVSIYVIDPVVRLASYNGHQAEVSAVCWLRRGEDFQAASSNSERADLFASGSYDGQIKIWDVREGDGRSSTGLGLALLEHQTRITRLAGAWDGRMLVSGDVDGVVKASSFCSWDLRNCGESLMTAQYNGTILDLQANRAFCVVSTTALEAHLKA
ncbi:hypothetical protein Efla_000606 [Eimeria flavescens]